MKILILGFPALGADAPEAVARGIPSAGARKEYCRMKAASEPLDGCSVVELWNSERGFQERYIANKSEPKKLTKKNEKTD